MPVPTIVVVVIAIVLLSGLRIAPEYQRVLDWLIDIKEQLLYFEQNALEVGCETRKLGCR